jgi:hypothetical protein
MTDRTKDIFKDWKDKRNFYLEGGKTSEKFFDNLIKNALVYSYDKSRKETLEEVEKMIEDVYDNLTSYSCNDYRLTMKQQLTKLKEKKDESR